MNIRHRSILHGAAAFVAALCAACGSSSPVNGGSSGGGGSSGSSSGGTTAASAIKVLSNRADLLSGGDALVEVVLPAGASASDVHVQLNGQDVTQAFALRANGRYLGCSAAWAWAATPSARAAQASTAPAPPWSTTP
ncbi:MAG TPA: DUF6351 family protein, partial [Nevskia sp.]|nr:DUF6351 family protein [Nevskia sp.]